MSLLEIYFHFSIRLHQMKDGGVLQNRSVDEIEDWVKRVKMIEGERAVFDAASLHLPTHLCRGHFSWWLPAIRFLSFLAF